MPEVKRTWGGQRAVEGPTPVGGRAPASPPGVPAGTAADPLDCPRELKALASRLWRGGLSSGRRPLGRCLDGLTPQGLRGCRRLPSGALQPGSPPAGGLGAAGKSSGWRAFRAAAQKFAGCVSSFNLECARGPPSFPFPATRSARCGSAPASSGARRTVLGGPGGNRRERLRGGRVLRKVGRE